MLDESGLTLAYYSKTCHYVHFRRKSVKYPVFSSYIRILRLEYISRIDI